MLNAGAQVGATGRSHWGQIRVTGGGHGIEGELWELPTAALGSVLAALPPPTAAVANSGMAVHTTWSVVHRTSDDRLPQFAGNSRSPKSFWSTPCVSWLSNVRPERDHFRVGMQRLATLESFQNRNGALAVIISVRSNHVSVDTGITMLVVGRGGTTLISSNEHAHVEEVDASFMSYR